MTRAENELDEFGKRTLSPLRPTPPMDPHIMPEERVRFLQKADSLRKNLIPTQVQAQSEPAGHKRRSLRGWFSLPIYKALVAIFLVVVFVAGSSISVYAAQSSLPGDPLYTIKSVSENIRMSLTFSTKAKLDLTLHPMQ